MAMFSKGGGKPQAQRAKSGGQKGKGQKMQLGTRSSLTTIAAVAVGVAVIALLFSLYAYNQARALKASVGDASETRIVAKEDIPKGTQLTDDMLVEQKVSTKVATEHSYTTVDDLKDADGNYLYTSAYIDANEIISKKDIAASDAPKSLTQALKEGEIPVEISVDSMHAMDPFLHVGWYVTLLNQPTNRGSSMAVKYQPLLNDKVRIIAIDGVLTDNRGDTSYSVITVAAKDEQDAQKILSASNIFIQVDNTSNPTEAGESAEPNGEEIVDSGTASESDGTDTAAESY